MLGMQSDPRDTNGLYNVDAPEREQMLRASVTRCFI